MTRIPRSALPAAVASLVVLATPGFASTLVRSGIEELTRHHDIVVAGTVRSLHSYWNADSTHIVTDVTLRPSDVLKGAPVSGNLTITLFGGTVGSRTTLVVGGPEIRTGGEYVLFLDRGRLPGTGEVLTTPGQAQAVFDVMDSPDGRRAVSQAISHGLVPDAQGRTAPPGGEAGLALEDLRERVLRLSRSLD